MGLLFHHLEQETPKTLSPMGRENGNVTQVVGVLGNLHAEELKEKRREEARENKRGKLQNGVEPFCPPCAAAPPKCHSQDFTFSKDQDVGSAEEVPLIPKVPLKNPVPPGTKKPLENPSSGKLKEAKERFPVLCRFRSSSDLYLAKTSVSFRRLSTLQSRPAWKKASMFSKGTSWGRSQPVLRIKYG